MANNPTIVAASLSDQDLKNSIDKLVNYVDKKTMEMAQNFDAGVELMKESLKKLGNVKIDFGGTSSGGGTKKAIDDQKSLEEQTKKTTQAVKEQNLTLDQQSSAQKNAVNSAKKYSEEVTKQAQAIREMKQFQEKGYAMVGDRVYYDPSRSVAPLKNILSLEEQILNTQKEQELEAIRRASAERQEAAEKAAVEQAAQRQLAAETQITNEQAKRSQPKNFTSYDSLRESIAHVLGLQQSQVKLADAETASYNNLDKTLKQLTQTYNRLSSSERNSDQGKALIASIHEVERAIQKVRSQAARPISLESILGVNGRGSLSEKTLDDIAYKMQRLASYRSGLDVDTQKKEINQVNSEYDRLKKKMDEVMQKNQQMVGSNNALGRSWNYMKNRLAFYFTVGASTQFIKNLIEVRSQYEMNERALGILINSAERGTQIFNELSQMALVSPYTLIELSNAAKQLTAYDIAANEVVDTTRRLADMASAVGVPMERLTYALGQIKAYGYLNSRDARMFANAGIPLVRELSKYYTELEGKMVSVGDVYDRMKKKAIDYNDVMSVVTKMTDEGGKFFDFQAKMADTLKVRLANLTLAWNNMLNDIGRSEQGVLTTGINLLKEFFLQWKNLSKAVENLAIGFGLVKTAQLLYYGVVMGTNKAIALEAVLGDKLSQKLRALTSSMNAAKMASSTLWVGIATMAAAAVVEIIHGNEAMKEFNRTIRENAKNTYNDLEKFKEQYKELRKSLYQTITDNNGKTIVTPQDINVDDAKKAWESVREQIELSSHASDKYIGSLLQIKNVSERLRQSFAVIDDIQSVSAAIKELGDGAIKLERDWSAWWNLWTLPDGTIGNLKDTHMWLGKIEEKYGSIEKARKAASGEDKALFGIDKNYQDDAERWLENYENELKKFREDLESTKESVLNFINAQGWSGNVNKVNETFKQITDNLIQQNQLDPEKAYTLQIEMEEARSKAAKEAQYIRLQDLRNAYMAEKDSLHKEEIAKEYEKEAEIYNNWNLYNGRQKVEWERFTKYLKEQHLSEMTAMFRGMNDEQIKSLNFQEGKYADWVKRMVTNYAKSHKMSYDEAFNYLKNWVASANKWSIFIPLTISTDENKTVMKTLEEADAAADKAWKDMQRLDKEIARLRKKGAKEVDENNITSSEDDQKLTKALKERAAAEKDYNKAVSEGGESKKENAANTKAQKQAESELQKALKEELKIIDEVSSAYKKMTDSGINRTTALSYLTSRFGESIEYINKILGKNNIPKFDIRKFAGTDDPNKLLEMLQEQISAAKLSKNVKPEEISELRIKYDNVDVDAKSYNATKIKKGLDNELGRLKDEYELAVELDANPELGSMFADMFDIDLDTLPRTAKEYAEVYTRSLNKYFKEMKTDIELPNIMNLTRDEMSEFQRQMEDGKLEKVYFELIQKGYEATQEARKKEVSDAIKSYDKLLEKYAEYAYKVKAIEKNANQERKALVMRFGTDEQKEDVAKIVTKLDTEEDPQKIEELKKQLENVVNAVVGDDKTRIDIKVAIDNKQAQETTKLSFEEFQKSPEWITATGDLAGMTHSALGMLIKDLEDYKKKATNLNPKQIKQLNSALKSLYTQQKNNNPFKFLNVAMLEAQNRMLAYDDDIKETSDKLEELGGETADVTKMTKEQTEEYETLKKRLEELRKEQSKVGKVSVNEIVTGINESISAVSKAVGMFGDLAEAIGGKNMTDAAKSLQEITSVVEKAGQGAQIGSSFGGYGAIIGAIVGGVTQLISITSQWNNDAITEKVNKTTLAVNRLTNAYEKLRWEIDRTFDMQSLGLQKASIASEELELIELKYQLKLEKSRKEKNKDYEKIAEIEKSISELERKIVEDTEDIINNLLGISSVKDAAEGVISSMIDAFKNGEDYMLKFSESFDKMIDNMIMKAIVGKVLGDRLQEIFNQVQEYADTRASSTMYQFKTWKDYDKEMELGKAIKYIEAKIDDAAEENEEDRKNFWEQELEKAIEAYSKLAVITPSDINDVRDKVNSFKDEVKEEFESWMDAFGIGYGESAESKELSALQQGIQGITEDTAGALEAYMNSVSQQVYLHSEILTQIRDIVVGYDLDLQAATMGQILLQLQESYQIQQNIHSLLQSALSANGMSFRVEMV